MGNVLTNTPAEPARQSVAPMQFQESHPTSTNDSMRVWNAIPVHDYYFEIAGSLKLLPSLAFDIRGTRLEAIRDIYRFVIVEMVKPRFIDDIGSYDLYEFHGCYYIAPHRPEMEPRICRSDEFAGGSIRDGFLYDGTKPWAKGINIAAASCRDLRRLGPCWVYATVRKHTIMCTNHKSIPMDCEVEMQ